jgi:hypothetical protein
MNSFGFPKDGNAQKQGRAGEAYFDYFVTAKLGWGYRRVPREIDFGIDGHIDVMAPSGPTGRSIAVQVKSGRSYFASKTDFGLRFVGENKHLNYYIHNRGPIIIVILNEDGSQGYWDTFEIEKTSPEGSDAWCMEIPFRNKLETSVASAWSSIAGPVTDQTEMIRRMWDANKQLEDASLLFIAIPKIEVEALSMETVRFVIGKFCRTTPLVLSKRFSLEIFFPDYIDDPRELYEIPEVRKWFWASLYLEKIPWFYFLNVKGNVAGLRLLELCTLNVHVERRGDGRAYTRIEATEHENRKWIEKQFECLNIFTDKLGLPVQVNKEATFKPMNALRLLNEKARKQFTDALK